MVPRKTAHPSIALVIGALLVSGVVEARSPAGSGRGHGVSTTRARRSMKPVVNNQVIFCQNKTPERVARDFGQRIRGNDVLIGTKATRAHFEALRTALGGKKLAFDEGCGVITFKKRRIRHRGLIVVATAGTADIPVAEEAAKIAEAMGNKVQRVYDCGVNDPEKVDRHKRVFRKPNAIIAVAGMEGGLPNAIAALTDKPIIAVPTSVGYGTGLGGLSALMGMLNACSPGISVVNIDNGFGAAYVADRINKQSLH
jgi:NCAIR mutase (PurE)-related protein